MMPRVKGAKLLCKGFIEDYEVELELDTIEISKVHSSASTVRNENGSK